MRSKTTETLRVRVLKSDIRKGVEGSCSRCPIAIAVRRLAPRGKSVVVTWDEAILGHTTTYDLPRVASRFIDRFDEGKPVKPFSFTATRYL